MIVDVKPLNPIRGVINGVIMQPMTLDLNLIKIKKCMMFGNVTYKNVLLTKSNVEDIYNNGLPTGKKETMNKVVEEGKSTPVVEEPKKEVIKEEETVTPEVEATKEVVEETTEKTEENIVEDVKVNNNQQYSKKNKNKNQR